MSLRSRLFVTSVAVAVPLALVWFLVDGRLRLANKADELRFAVAVDVENGLQVRCEANPPAVGRPGRAGGPPSPGAGRGFVSPRDGSLPGTPGEGPPRRPGRGGLVLYEYFAYDPSGRPTAADAPPLPAERDGARTSSFWEGTTRGVSLVVPLGSAGPCAFVLARVPPRPGELRDQVQALALVVFSVFAAVWFAAGPVIAKLRRLEAAVRRSASAHYDEPVAVEGRDEVAAVAAAFNDAGRRVRAHVVEVQAREASLRGFVANTTHDVAIPLTVLQGHLAELDRHLSSQDQRAHVLAAMQEAHYMGSLLRNLGAATKLDESSAPMVLSPIDVSALVERVVARHRPVARTSGVELNVAVPDPPLVFASDDTLLEQALSNLVDNAIRYNHAEGHVAVLLDHVGDGFVLSVTDDGPGVSTEELSQLTTRWFRGFDARTRRPDGKGLGLAIVNESVKRLGLALTFTRSAEGGLRAEVRSVIRR